MELSVFDIFKIGVGPSSTGDYLLAAGAVGMLYAANAVNSARIALRTKSKNVVSLGQVIRTMRQTGLDMQSKYKETSTGGLAINITEWWP